MQRKEAPSGSRAYVAALTVRLLDARFFRFLVAGGVNTVFGYGVFYIFLRLSGSPIFALAVGTVFGVIFNFFTTGSFVFRVMERRRFWRFIAVYAIVFVYNAIGIKTLQRLGIDPAVGGLMLLPGAVVLSYALNRSFTFAQHHSPSTRLPSDSGKEVETP